MTTKGNKETAALLAEGDTVTLVSGTEVKIERLRTRQLFKLVKILTSGAAHLIPNLNIGPDASADEFAGSLLGMAIIAIPEAEDEAIDFVRSMVTPVGINEKPVTKTDREANEELFRSLYEELYNPDLDDFVTIITTVIQNEAEHIQALGKRLMSLLKVSQQAAAVGSSSKKNSGAETPEA